MVAIVLWRSPGYADFRFTDISGARRLKPASVILLRGPSDPIVVVVALITADHWGISRCFGKGDLPLVGHLRGSGMAQDFRAFQSAVGHKARGSRAGYVIHLLTGGGGGDVNGKFRPAGNRLRSLGASTTHDGARLSVIEVVVVGGRGSRAQVTVVDAGGRHGITKRGAGGPT